MEKININIMITKVLDITTNNKLYKENQSIEILKGFYNKGIRAYFKRLKREVRLWL